MLSRALRSVHMLARWKRCFEAQGVERKVKTRDLATAVVTTPDSLRQEKCGFSMNRCREGANLAGIADSIDTLGLWRQFISTYREIGGQKDYAVFGHCVIQCP